MTTVRYFKMSPLQIGVSPALVCSSNVYQGGDLGLLIPQFNTVVITSGELKLVISLGLVTTGKLKLD